MAFNVARHAVDDVRHGYAGVSVVSVVVDDGGGVDATILAEGPEPLVPVDMSVQVST